MRLFFNKKNDVLDIILTEKGKELLAKGLFNPKYYDFSDDDILYNDSDINIQLRPFISEQVYSKTSNILFTKMPFFEIFINKDRIDYIDNNKIYLKEILEKDFSEYIFLYIEEHNFDYNKNKFISHFKSNFYLEEYNYQLYNDVKSTFVDIYNDNLINDFYEKKSYNYEILINYLDLIQDSFYDYKYEFIKTNVPIVIDEINIGELC